MVAKVDDVATSMGCNNFARERKLLTTIAPLGAEDIASKAFGVNPNFRIDA